MLWKYKPEDRKGAWLNRVYKLQYDLIHLATFKECFPDTLISHTHLSQK